MNFSANQVVGYGKSRHTDDPSGHTEHGAEEHDCEDDPEAGKTCGITQDNRTEDISVKLLQNNNENQEIQRLQRIDHENDHGADDSADIGTEERNNVGYTDDKGNQDRERRSDKFDADKAQNADDNRIQDFAGQETDENPVDVTTFRDHFVGCLLFEQCINDLLELRSQFILGIKQIDGNNQSDRKVKHIPDDGNDALGNSGNNS